MMDKETYKKELVRMWDSLRTENKGGNSCHGVECNERCAFYGDERSSKLICYDDCINAVEMVEAIEKWSKEHPQTYNVSKLEYDILKYISDNTEHMYITRNIYGNVYLFNEEPRKSGDCWYGRGSKYMGIFNELFRFIQWEDEEPTSIQDILKNCEVKKDV